MTTQARPSFVTQSTLSGRISPSLLLILAVSFLLVALPFLGIGSLGISDYANHMARFHIRQNFADSEALQELYVLKESPYQYWGMEIVMRALTPIFGVEGAAYGFTIISFYLPLAGALTLNRIATGRTNFFALAAGLLFVFSEPAGWGFTNFLFTLGLALFVFAAWLATDEWGWLKRVLLFAILATLIAQLHLVSAGLLGAALGVWELARWFGQHEETPALPILKILTLVLSFTPAALLVLKQIVMGVGGSGMFWLSIEYHLYTLFSPVFFIRGGIGAYWHFLPVVLIWLALRQKGSTARFDRPLLWVAGFIAVLGIVTPFSVSGVGYIGMRFPLLAAFIAAASINDGAKLKLKSTGLFLMAAVAIKFGLVHAQLSHTDSRIDEMREASSIIPKGAKLLPLISGEANPSAFDPTPVPQLRYSNMAGYVVLDRDILFPYFFSMFDVGIAEEHSAYVTSQGYAEDIALLGTPEGIAFAQNWQSDFDYILQMNFGNGATVELPGTTVVHEGSWFTYRQIDNP